MSLSFPGESPEYRVARDRLLEREAALRRELEAVAVQRRDLPPGGLVPEDYVLQGDNGEVRLSDLFSPGHDTLVVYHYMFPRDPDDDRPGPASGESAQLKLEQGPCPSCTALLDQLDGAVEHFAPHADFAVVARAPIGHLRTFAAERGWRLRLFSCAGTTFSRDYHGEAADGSPRPMLNVFRHDADGLRHFWGSELLYEAGRAGPGPAPRRDDRAGVEPVRPHPARAWRGLGRAARLLP